MKKSCRLCESENLSSFLKVGKFRLLKCSSCQIVFTDPLPTKSLQKKINKELYGTSVVQKGYWERLPQLEKRVKKIVKEVKEFKKSGRLLDVGCGYGLFLKVAKEAGFEVYGVEREKQAVKAAKEEFNLENISQKRVEEMDFPEKYFDVITLFDVLEHLEKPKETLKRIKTILKPDGLLVLQSPNIESIMFKLTRDKWNWLLVLNHLYHFTPKTLISLIKDSGYKILQSKTFDDISEFNFNLLDAWNIRKSRGVGYKILWKLIRESRFLIHPLSLLYSKLGFGGLIRVYVTPIV